MLKCLCLGLTNEHYQDDTRLFGGTRPQSFPLLSTAAIYLLLGSFKETLRVGLLYDLKHQAPFTRQQLRLILLPSHPSSAAILLQCLALSLDLLSTQNNALHHTRTKDIFGFTNTLLSDMCLHTHTLSLCLSVHTINYRQV